MSFKVLSVGDNSWSNLMLQWEVQCKSFDQEFEEFSTATLGVLGQLARDGHLKAEVYGYFNAEDCQAVCEVNRTMLPGYEGYVLRVRNMTFSPTFDFTNVGVDAYGAALTGLFAGVLSLSHGSRGAAHIKFHLRSPADRTFFQSLTEPLLRFAEFDSVEVKGAWLYVTKKK